MRGPVGIVDWSTAMGRLGIGAVWGADAGAGAAWGVEYGMFAAFPKPGIEKPLLGCVGAAVMFGAGLAHHCKLGKSILATPGP